ncbi:MAG: hypothetical protein WCB44_09085 [Stellaceae bacterium]
MTVPTLLPTCTLWADPEGPEDQQHDARRQVGAPRSEAGADCLFIKFGAVRSGPGAAERFDALLNAAGGLAVASGMNTLFAGVNLARDEAYRQMIGRGFRSQAQIVTLHRPNAPGYSRPGVYALDDWR